MAEDNSLLSLVIIIFQQSLLHVNQQFLLATSKIKRNCMQLHLSATSTHESLGTRLQSLLPLVSLHFLLLIGIYFSEAYDDRNALRNLCCASAIFSIHTHILGPCVAKEYVLWQRAMQLIGVYSSAMQVCTAIYINTASSVHFPP